MKTAFVWHLPPPIFDFANDVFIGTHYLSAICDVDYLWWGKDDKPPDSIKDYDCAIVSLFGDMQHVTQIKAQNPDCYVIALPDSYFDDMFVNYSIWDMNMLSQIQAADCIGYVSESNRQFYGSLFPNKPTVKIPVPIGRDEWFLNMRSQPKQDFIITCDHAQLNGERPLDYSIQNVAAVARIQRETGMQVVYVNTAPKTREYAKYAGLKASFASYIDFETYARLAATARLGVDMYSIHGYGRNTLMYAYAGTPAIGSTYTEFYECGCDAWMAEDAAALARLILEDTSEYARMRLAGIERVKLENSVGAARKQMIAVLNEVQT